MADFDAAFNATMGHEGGYANDPDDRGGETYKGIARNFHGDWPGWKWIDQAKTMPGFPYNLPQFPELDGMVRAFYREHYWNKVRGDDLTQLIADEMFDTAVNQGIGWAVMFLQEALNVFNRNGKLYPDLSVDGVIGDKTIAAFNAYLRTDMDSNIYKALNILQGARYLDIMRGNPSQEKYARGWLDRVSFKKHN